MNMYGCRVQSVECMKKLFLDTQCELYRNVKTNMYGCYHVIVCYCELETKSSAIIHTFFRFCQPVTNKNLSESFLMHFLDFFYQMNNHRDRKYPILKLKRIFFQNGRQNKENFQVGYELYSLSLWAMGSHFDSNRLSFSFLEHNLHFL